MPKQQRKRAGADGNAAPAQGQDPILAALGDLGQATSRQIADHTTLAYSTVTAGLRRLHEVGQAEKTTDGRTATWRLTGPAATGTDEPANRPRISRAETKTGRSGRAGDPAATADEPSASGGGPGGTVRRRGDRPTATTPAGADGAADGKPRRGHGKLREQVLELMQTHPDDTWTVTRLSKALDGASPGAIVLAARKLVADGNAKEVLARPATFQAE